MHQTASSELGGSARIWPLNGTFPITKSTPLPIFPTYLFSHPLLHRAPSTEHPYLHGHPRGSLAPFLKQLNDVSLRHAGDEIQLVADPES